MSGTFKWYYLAQLAFWVQQILVIHIEARRKDHAQMLTHHIITCTLVSVTYFYRYTRAANVVLCLMDVVDLILPVRPRHHLLGYGYMLIWSIHIYRSQKSYDISVTKLPATLLLVSLS